MWQDGSAMQEFSVQSAGLYSLPATNRCGTDSNSIQIGYIDAPAPFYLGPDGEVPCCGLSSEE